MSPTARSRIPLSLLAALVLHAAGLLLVRAVPPRPLELSTIGHAFERAPELWIDLRPLEIASSPEPPRGALEMPPSAPEPAPLAAVLPRRTTSQAPAPPEPNPVPPPSSAPPPAGASDYDGPPDEPPRAGALPALAGPPVWAVPGAMPREAAPTPAPIRPTAQAVLAGSAEQARFPAAGTLASAVTEQVRSSSTPSDSDSTFLLTLDTRGQIASVDVVAAKGGDRKEWERIARAVKDQFAGRVFPMPTAFAGGGRVFVSVKSQLVLPAGTKDVVSNPRPALMGGNTSIVTLPGVRDDRLSSLMTTHLPPDAIMIGFQFDFDVTNIGARKRRVVHTRVHAEPIGAAPPPHASP
ncbi:hypothetical protein [Polyangium mundeleinium]|uniref:TonB C-terminal domain-containing protein n=1 Tax=Polyangium mundeleinium TaxID=2995306 RepID=A0ABT5EI98_9BACT|nr:hypothetical protein [Polyangium mundeleinium]MDC0740486.1 hypothetical protein [Polyangium mundeleinium]